MLNKLRYPEPDGGASPEPRFQIVDEPGTPPAAELSSIDDDKALSWLQERSGGKIKSPEDLQALLSPQVDEESRSLIDLGRKVRENPFVQGVVEYATQPGGQQRLDQYLSVMRVAEKTGELSDFDAIVWANHFKEGLDVNLTREALRDEYQVDELESEDSSLSAAQRAKLEYKMKLAAKEARASLGELAEKYKMTPEQRDAEAQRQQLQVAEQKRLDGFSGLLTGVKTLVPAIEETIELSSPSGKLTIPLRYDIQSDPARSQEFQKTVEDLVKAYQVESSPEVNTGILDVAKQLFIGRHFKAIMSSLAAEIAGNAELQAAGDPIAERSCPSWRLRDQRQPFG